MAEEKKMFRNIFISGLLILIPIAATIVVLGFMFNLLDSWLSPYGAYILRAFGVALPADWKNIPGFGIVATFVLICLTGLFASNYLGRRLLKVVEKFIGSLPLINNVYNGMRQLVEAFSSGQGKAFKTVVMLEFPQRGNWTLGFLTSESALWAQKAARQTLVNVFIPAAPIPSQGILVLVPRHKLKVLPLSVEEAFKFIATLGLVTGKAKDRLPAGILPEGSGKAIRRPKNRL
jgi:uncharacterized membrane protein